MTKRKVTLELSQAEALVFFDWLCRFNKTEGDVFEDQAEQRVLWDIEAKLESSLADPFDPRYKELLMAARAMIRDHEG